MAYAENWPTPKLTAHSMAVAARSLLHAVAKYVLQTWCAASCLGARHRRTLNIMVVAMFWVIDRVLVDRGLYAIARVRALLLDTARNIDGDVNDGAPCETLTAQVPIGCIVKPWPYA